MDVIYSLGIVGGDVLGERGVSDAPCLLVLEIFLVRLLQNLIVLVYLQLGLVVTWRDVRSRVTSGAVVP